MLYYFTMINIKFINIFFFLFSDIVSLKKDKIYNILQWQLGSFNSLLSAFFEY